jgi:hypothetical protein
MYCVSYEMSSSGSQTNNKRSLERDINGSDDEVLIVGESLCSRKQTNDNEEVEVIKVTDGETKKKKSKSPKDSRSSTQRNHNITITSARPNGTYTFRSPLDVQYKSGHKPDSTQKKLFDDNITNEGSSGAKSRYHNHLHHVSGRTFRSDVQYDDMRPIERRLEELEMTIFNQSEELRLLTETVDKQKKLLKERDEDITELREIIDAIITQVKKHKRKLKTINDSSKK